MNNYIWGGWFAPTQKADKILLCKEKKNLFTGRRNHTDYPLRITWLDVLGMQTANQSSLKSTKFYGSNN